MDIRSYFSVKKEKKVQDNDSDVIPGTPEVKVKEKKSRKRRQITDDSDEETSQKKKSSKSSNDHNKSKKLKSPLKEVKACDIFSKSSIKRTDPLVKKAKKETEIVIHSDDEFEKTLLDLNTDYDTEESNKNNLCKSDSTENDKKSLEKHEHKLTQDEKHKKHDIESSAIIDEHIEETNKKARKRKPDEENGEFNHKKDTPDNEEKKKDFKVFLENDDSLVACDEIDRSVEIEPKRKKAKLDKSLNESVLSDEERHERKRYSAALYQKYLNRTGPKNLGSKEIPKGAPKCLQDCVFLLTGVLDSFERDEIVAAITEYGGVVKNGMSKKITHVLAGEDAGPAKIAKAQEFGIKILKEDEFLQMISDSLNSKSSKNNISEKKENKSEKKHEQRLTDIKETDEKHEDKQNKKTKVENSVNSFGKDKKSINGIIKSDTKIKKERKSLSPEKADVKRDMNVKDKSKSRESKSETKFKVKEEKKSPKKLDKVEITEKEESKIKDEKVNTKDDVTLGRTVPSPSLMWVDKYKPQTVKQIIGQHGEASNVKKLTNWLTKWYANREAKLPKPSPWAKNDDGGYYKAALLSGPPGVGKTTTVSLVCKELGFDTVEFNASDTRSKTLIREQIGQLLTTSSLAGYAKGISGKGAVSKKHVLVMDEVDGMAGNEDRGGLQELISLIKTSSVPIVCMCNDRNSDKMRTLVNYCYDLRFSRPRADQIKAAMMSICFKEGVKVPSDVMSAVISAAGQDVRQVLHLLAMWAADTHRPHSAAPTKDVKMGPWEAIRKVFSAEEHKTMSMNDKSDLFFTDYNIMPLFVQENYLSAAPNCNKSEVLDRISKAADSISLGDVVDARIRSGQAWSLLPVQAMYASVIPGHHMAGQLRSQIQFPGWLGRNSRAQRMRRLAQDIHAHTRLSTSGSKSSIFLDYASHLRNAVVSPLVAERAAGVDRALAVLEAYRLAREDLDSLTEISLWPGQRNPMLLIDSKVKAAMTRAYNKKATPLPYLPQAVKKGSTHDNDAEHFEDDEDDDNDDGDPENDVLIKKKKNEAEKPTKSKSRKK